MTLYRHFDSTGKLLYVGIARNWIARLEAHQGSVWFKRITEVRLQHFEDEAGARLAEEMAIRSERPLFNVVTPQRRPTVMHALRGYLSSNGITQQGFAELVGVSQGLVHQWLVGLTAINPEKAKEIEAKTGIPRMKLLYPGERAA